MVRYYFSVYKKVILLFIIFPIQRTKKNIERMKSIFVICSKCSKVYPNK